MKKLYHRCLSICLLLLFYKRGSSRVSEKRNQLFGTILSRTVESLSIRKGRRLHHKLFIDFSVFDDDDGHKRGQTSRPVVGTEIQTNCNFEAHVYYGNYL